MSARPTRPFGHALQLIVGPVLWFAHFTLLYGAEALICTPPIASGRGMMWVASAATVAALSALAMVAARLIRAPRHDDDDARFLRSSALMLAGLSALGVVWTALPVAMLIVCMSPAG